MRVALVHDWLLGMRGGERCLEVLCELFPEADIYTLFYDAPAISSKIREHRVMRSWLGALPNVRAYYRYLLPIFSLGMRHLSRRLRQAHRSNPYDLVISVSHCVAKNIDVPLGVSHICYCLTPTRYLWDQYDRYFHHHPLEPVIRLIVKPLRAADVAASDAVDHFIGISNFIAARIERVYGREADVIYPPVRADWIAARNDDDQGKGFLCVNALVPYKNVHAIIEAFNVLQLPLTIVGTGPEESRLKGIAASNIRFVGWVSDLELAELYRTSRALVFAAEEDFGMTPVEMQLAGRPVIGLKAGGCLETIVGSGSRPTGVFFETPEKEAIINAVQYFLDQEQHFTVDNCLKNAAQFSVDQFSARFAALLQARGILTEPLRKVA